MKALLVFLAVAALSVLASSRRLLQAGRFFQLAQLAASGLLFLAMGAALGPSAAGMLSREDLFQSRPLLALGLGLGGILIGLHLDFRLLRGLPTQVYRAAALQSVSAFVLVALPLAPVLFLTSKLSPLGAVGAAALLGAAASVSSGHLAVLWHRSGRIDRLRGLSLSLLAMLDDLSGLAVLALALAFGAADDPASGLGLVAMAALVGLLCGMLAAFLLHGSSGPAERMAILLGSVALVSGAAAFLRVSTLISGLACGAMLALIGGRSADLVYRALARFERPAYLVLVFLIGAHVELGRLEIWAVLPGFVALRFMGKVLGGQLALRAAGDALALPARPGYALLAQGAVSLCVLAEYQLLVPGAASELVLGVGALGALVNEAIASAAFRRSLSPERAEPGGGLPPEAAR
ncbi:MAG: sodium:proton exchanger [Myxococcales bacterium]|nr:sodium:proton exchanger [Myxococcales bacterium]